LKHKALKKARRRLRKRSYRLQHVAVDLLIGILSNLITDRMHPGNKKGSRPQPGAQSPF
jgi:hypothetical protein